MKKFRISLLGWVGIAILSGILLGQVLPEGVSRIFVTFNSLFGNFLSFVIPLIILGLVAPAIGELGKGAGRLLLLTALIAYCSTIFSGFFTYFSSNAIYLNILEVNNDLTQMEGEATSLTSFFVIDIPPLFDIMSALILSFIIGLGLSLISGDTLQKAFADFKEIITKLISSVIVPLLPLHIFGIFLNISSSGQVVSVMSVFVKVIIVVFVLHVLILLIYFTIGGMIGKKNPLMMLKTMLPAYATALGTQSSAATIPVTLRQAMKLGTRESIAAFVVPLCATIHMPGSMMKIVSCSMAIMIMTGEPISLSLYAGFIMMLAITMVAAPGVPGGAIMAALGLLGSMLGFTDTQQALMIALYIAMDSFGTACNVTVDGAVSVVIDKIAKWII
jgi:Na+/H+-dicarboxylate symporters